MKFKLNYITSSQFVPADLKSINGVHAVTANKSMSEHCTCPLLHIIPTKLRFYPVLSKQSEPALAIQMTGLSV